MDKKPKAVYEPGELDRVRGKLGNIDHNEAKRVAQLLGGEVGTEKSKEPESIRSKPPIARRAGSAGRSSQDKRPSKFDEFEKNFVKPQKEHKPDADDDPSKPLKLRYFERVKMDRYASQPVFEIKSFGQVLVSIFSFFKEPVDYINPRFVTRIMNDHYSKIEQLVTSTRTVFPRTNARRSNKLKRLSPFAYTVLETIRSWDIETIAKEMALLQARPRSVRLSEFAIVLRLIYKPLFIMENLEMEEHVKGTFKLLYKVLYIESPMEAKEKYQDIIRNIIAFYTSVRSDVKFSLYPMLMKLTSDRLLSFESFFIQRRRRCMAFLDITEQDLISTEGITAQLIEDIDDEAIKEESQTDDAEDGEVKEENSEDPKVIERKAREEAATAERKALEQGLSVLETLFPTAGWEKLNEFPDLYPYFANVYSLRRGFELVAPSDPLQQVSVLMHILEDLFFGMRYVKLGAVTDSGGVFVNVESQLQETINGWQRYIDSGFYKEYLPRLLEYCRVLENSTQSRTSPFVRKLVNELHWIKRLYFLPYYKFETSGPPPLQKQEVITIYTEVRTLRKYLTLVAAGIEQGMRDGGPEAKALCDGINNPWENYKFEVPNPVSKRLKVLLPPGKRNNAALIFFSLAVVTVLDHIVNNENSWGYSNRSGPLFRSAGNNGDMPQFGVDKKLDADKIFLSITRNKEKEATAE